MTNVFELAKTLPNTWTAVMEAERGHVFADVTTDEGFRLLIVRGPSAMCAYLGVPMDSPLAGHNYDDVPIDCHGGLTFGQAGEAGTTWPEGRYWYGWDYGHAGDYSTYDDKYGDRGNGNDVKWTPSMVARDSWGAVYSLGKLQKLVAAARLR